MAAPIVAPTTFAFSFPPTIKLDKLDGTNWQAWNNTLTALMRMNGCQCHLTHVLPAHPDPANPDAGLQQLWDRQQEVLIGLLTLYTTSEVYTQVASDVVYPSVHDKYQHLETLYGKVGSMATFNAWVGLVNTKLQEGLPFCPQLQAMLEARNTLAENGMTFSDMQMCFILLDALPPSYSTVAGAILAQGAPAALLPQDLINGFLNEESHLIGPSATLAKVAPVNKISPNKGKQWAQKLQQPSSSTSQGSSLEVTCYYCQQPGHKKPDCKKMKWDQENARKGKEGQIRKAQQQANVMATAPVQGQSVTITPTPLPEWNMNDNMKCLVNRARTLSKLKSDGEEDYEEEWAGIGCMVSAETFEFGLHTGKDPQEGSRD